MPFLHSSRSEASEATLFGRLSSNIPPETVIAQATLYGTSGGGTQYTGIKRYRKRLPTGADQDIDFGEWPSWPPIIFDRVSSVTFAIATGSNQQAWTLARMDHWG
jgi:hypothetical protein